MRKSSERLERLRNVQSQVTLLKRRRAETLTVQHARQQAELDEIERAFGRFESWGGAALALAAKSRNAAADILNELEARRESLTAAATAAEVKARVLEGHWRAARRHESAKAEALTLEEFVSRRFAIRGADDP